ncbi:MAG: DUF433 domain-containing protein [Fimbriiglobus sp.]
MQLEDFFDIEGTPPTRIRLKGTRINLEHLIPLYQAHKTPMQIATFFVRPLEPVQVYAAITYYLSHKVEMDDYFRRVEEEGDRLRIVVEAMPGNAALKEKLQRMKEERSKAQEVTS